ncbi:hypothetical protein RRG08_036359 [Elysia crispata]|uniref:Uncharacterized protein n=1 Tax=Elysia crispata TaxID=231223 RepID=A0AAE0ZLQ5_9GAST|nr:hypothetical protein RRG08_036359 [Elysia crispata]
MSLDEHEVNAKGGEDSRQMNVAWRTAGDSPAEPGLCSVVGRTLPGKAKPTRAGFNSTSTFLAYVFVYVFTFLSFPVNFGNTFFGQEYSKIKIRNRIGSSTIKSLKLKAARAYFNFEHTWIEFGMGHGPGLTEATIHDRV